MRHSTEQIGQRIEKLRKDRGLSRAELARALDMEATKIQDIERGRQRVDHETLMKLKRYFRADYEWLLEGAMGVRERKHVYCVDQKEKEQEASGREAQDELEMLAMYRQLDRDQKAAIRETLRAFAPSRARKKKTG